METKETNINEYLEKIVQIESMLKEVKQGIFLLDKEFQESIERGEEDIKERRVTICKTEQDLDDFFASI